MDTTNGQMWMFDGNKRWNKFGKAITEQIDEMIKLEAKPDPTGKVRPKPEADFNKEPAPPVELREKLEQTNPTEKPRTKAVPKPPKVQ